MVILSFAGYLVTILSARMLARRRDNLDLFCKRPQRVLWAAVCRL
jgi:hypothetical protein